MGAEYFLPHLLADAHALFSGKLKPLLEVDFLGLLEGPSNTKHSIHRFSVARQAAPPVPSQEATSTDRRNAHLFANQAIPRAINAFIRLNLAWMNEMGA
jgi:hypothetical protein